MLKQYVVRKYVMARSGREALRIEKRHPADEVWLDEDWKKAQDYRTAQNMGFNKKKR